MDVSSLKSDNIGQYLKLITNPAFLNAVKSAAKSADGNGKYDALLENLGKLSSLLNQGDESESATSSNPLAALFGNTSAPRLHHNHLLHPKQLKRKKCYGPICWKTRH